MTTYEAYQQLKSACLPLITYHQEDLTVIDEQTLAETFNQGVPFIHYTRSHGTHLTMLNPAEAYSPEGVQVPFLFGSIDRWKELEQTAKAAEYHANPYNPVSLAIHYFDGKTLRKITHNEAIYVSRQYRHRMERLFGEYANVRHAKQLNPSLVTR